MPNVSGYGSDSYSKPSGFGKLLWSYAKRGYKNQSELARDAHYKSKVVNRWLRSEGSLLSLTEIFLCMIRASCFTCQDEVFDALEVLKSEIAYRFISKDWEEWEKMNVTIRKECEMRGLPMHRPQIDEQLEVRSAPAPVTLEDLYEKLEASEQRLEQRLGKLERLLLYILDLLKKYFQ